MWHTVGVAVVLILGRLILEPRDDYQPSHDHTTLFVKAERNIQGFSLPCFTLCNTRELSYHCQTNLSSWVVIAINLSLFMMTAREPSLGFIYLPTLGEFESTNLCAQVCTFTQTLSQTMYFKANSVTKQCSSWKSMMRTNFLGSAKPFAGKYLPNLTSI